MSTTFVIATGLFFSGWLVGFATASKTARRVCKANQCPWRKPSNAP